ncbi:MAG: helix-turn-helix domain-containing protein, partial [Nitrospira sp.]
MKIHPVTLVRLAKSGDVPGAKPGKCWVFIDVDLADWLRAQYKLRASEGGLRNERKQKICHSSDVKTPRYGGLTSPSTGNAYSVLLA